MKVKAQLGLATVLLSSTLLANAAIRVDVSKKDLLSQFSLLSAEDPTYVSEVSRSVDFNKTTHIRFRQVYAGYPVWGADTIIHKPQSARQTSNGILFFKLKADLVDAPREIFTAAHADEALQEAIHLASKKYQLSNNLLDKKAQLMVYVDKDNKAHWAFLVSFYSPRVSVSVMPVKPTYILDARTMKPYTEWNDVKSEATAEVRGGGVGGNIKIGKLYYDSQKDHLASFAVQRDESLGICYLQNQDVIVKDLRAVLAGRNVPVQYGCKELSNEHRGLYWNDLDDSANDGYSPNNDAIYAITLLKGMYQRWYGIDPVTVDGKSVPITVYTHKNEDNASWEGNVSGEWLMELGDGGSVKYPSTAVGVISHELGHGFTERHSNLVYEKQSGGLNESFSDMADQAAQYYVFKGKNNWMHDAEITKAEGKALRYMDQPSRDCEGVKKPGSTCSIDHISQYKETTNVHYSSGLFNRVYYLIGTAPGWNARKAFNIMVDANINYWIPGTTFAEAACGVIQATRDHHYDLKTVRAAFTTVGIETESCH